MALAIFLRAVNVGGRKLRPKALAEALDLVNVGAAGTFVAPGRASAGAVERAVRRALPFETEVMVCAGEELLRLARADPFAAAPAGADRYVSVLAAPPAARPPLPLERPEGKPWNVRVVGLDGRYALSLWRRNGPRALYPNAVVEQALGVAATTRGWETVMAICRILQGT